MKRPLIRLALLAAGVAAAALPPAATAQQAPATSSAVVTAPGKAMATRTTKASAVIVALDAANRLITLKTANGKTFEVTAGPEVKNFDQLKVGQKVHAEYAEALSLELKKGGGGKSAASEKAGAAAAQPGQKPGAVAGRQVTVLADVVAVDHKTHLVTLRGPAGNQIDIQVDDPEQLKNIKKGDQVEASYTEAIAVMVETGAK
jgi:hypothetical protein